LGIYLSHTVPRQRLPAALTDHGSDHSSGPHLQMREGCVDRIRADECDHRIIAQPCEDGFQRALVGQRLYLKQREDTDVDGLRSKTLGQRLGLPQRTSDDDWRLVQAGFTP